MPLSTKLFERITKKASNKQREFRAKIQQERAQGHLYPIHLRNTGVTMNSNANNRAREEGNVFIATFADCINYDDEDYNVYATYQQFTHCKVRPSTHYIVRTLDATRNPDKHPDKYVLDLSPSGMRFNIICNPWKECGLIYICLYIYFFITRNRKCISYALPLVYTFLFVYFLF